MVSGVDFLLSLLDRDDAAVVRGRIGVEGPGTLDGLLASWQATNLPLPRAVLAWMLERDDPATNSFVYHRLAVNDPVRTDIVLGTPFGRATGPLPVRLTCTAPYCSHTGPPPPDTTFGTLDGLRRARTMKAGRRAAYAVRRADWPEIAAADRTEPLPGYARWALALRLDCPDAVRAQFSTHPKHDTRLRKAGLVAGPADYLRRDRPARDVLGVLSVVDDGTRPFPDRLREVAHELEPLVRGELGADPEAWSVLLQLLPTFTGTVRELVLTSAAVAGA
ncbi:hypothetical protein BN6_28340 [Saccharothrix espanaensis DSM 44229]|uniref:Uncharacterized protein n=1 Tax=Saccharothrix espanaensis (strain ATCC 51144 / DSM 44229 / JCM 9112 / NBRC 15066 / NRRL 15764) TaxID=1179773 RepID=K0JRD0_SACES|nr:hypothetical protein BN6_28340 [Saccharothrix espanaensis DSM 44229]